MESRQSCKVRPCPFGEVCQPQGWNQGKAARCVRARSEKFASLKDGIKAKHRSQTITLTMQFASLKDGIKAKLQAGGERTQPKFASLKDGIKAKPPCCPMRS